MKHRSGAGRRERFGAGGVRAAGAWTVAALAFCLALGGGSVGASIKGTRGLIHIPTADVLPEGRGVIGAHGSEDLFTSFLGYGIQPFVEIGVLQVLGEPVSGFLKGRIAEETADRPAIATGFEAGDFFFVASKTFRTQWRAHVGTGTGRFRGLFAGVAFVGNPVRPVRAGGRVPPLWTAIVEYDAQSFNGGVRLTTQGGWEIDATAKRLPGFHPGVTLRWRF